jgi:hypothetical protein
MVRIAFVLKQHMPKKQCVRRTQGVAHIAHTPTGYCPSESVNKVSGYCKSGMSILQGKYCGSGKSLLAASKYTATS